MIRSHLGRVTSTVTGLAVLAAPAVPPAAASAEAGGAAPTVVRVADLARGSAAAVPWLEGNVVHTASGRKVTLPWSRPGARRDHLRLLGRTDIGWLVKAFDGGDTWHVWSVKGGRRTHVSQSSVYEGLWLSHGVSDDGRRMYTQEHDELANDVIVVEDLATGAVTRYSSSPDPEVLSFSGPQAVIGIEDAQRWDVAADTTTPLGVDATGASIAHDVLFVTDETGRSGPTPLSAPGVPAWTAEMTDIRVSPDGARVLSRTPGRLNVIEIRDLATGQLQRTFDVRWPASGSEPVWESDTSIVFVAATTGIGDRVALVRCRVVGRCVRISDVVARDTITLPRVRE